MEPSEAIEIPEFLDVLDNVELSGDVSQMGPEEAMEVLCGGYRRPTYERLPRRNPVYVKDLPNDPEFFDVFDDGENLEFSDDVQQMEPSEAIEIPEFLDVLDNVELSGDVSQMGPEEAMEVLCGGYRRPTYERLPRRNPVYVKDLPNGPEFFDVIDDGENLEFSDDVQQMELSEAIEIPEYLDVLDNVELSGDVSQMGPAEAIEVLCGGYRREMPYHRLPNRNPYDAKDVPNFENEKSLMKQLSELLVAQDSFLTDFILSNQEEFQVKKIMEKKFPETWNQLNVLHETIERTVKDIQKNSDAIEAFRDTQFDKYLQNLLRPGIIRRPQDHFEVGSLIQNENEKNDEIKEEIILDIPEYEEEVCENDEDCFPYGECNTITQKCECFEGWTGVNCDIKIVDENDVEASRCFEYPCSRTCYACHYYGPY